MAVSTADGASRRRAEAILEVAAEHGTGVPIPELRALLPPGELPFEPDPAWPQVDGRVYLSENAARGRDPARALRAARVIAVAEEYVRHDLAPASGLLCAVAISGSVAFGEPVAGDDCDFLVITRRGAVWPFLVFAYLAARWRGRRSHGPDEPSTWCMNYVLDASAADRIFGREQGFQFAREALTVRPVEGERYYRELLAKARWMASEAPGLYGRWSESGEPTDSPEPPRAAPLAFRALNWALYPFVATYLQLVAVRDNARLRKAGQADRAFEIQTHPDRVEVRSRKFAQIAAKFERASATGSSS